MTRSLNPARLAALGLVALLLVTAGAAETTWPGAKWATAAPAEMGLVESRLEQARAYALTGGGSGLIVRHGKVVIAWGDLEKRYDLKSTAKSIGVTALGLALKDGKVQLDDPAIKHQPALGVPPESNRATGWLERITLRHLANQSSGFEKPGGYGALLFAPGTKFHYSDAGPNWLAECLTLAYGRDLNEVMFERVFTRLDIKRSDLVWREHAYRAHEINGIKRREFGSGFSANVNAMARLGLLYLREGRWQEWNILPADFVALVRQPAKALAGIPENEPTHGNASEHYSTLWWNNGDGTLANVPRDAYWSWGLFESLIVVIPSLDLVIARAGDSWKRAADGGHFDVLRPFFEPIVAAVREFEPDVRRPAPATAAKRAGAPYPPSPVIKGITWAPGDQIRRKAPGGDNWPMTWADDDVLYTAYGDGNGFEPFVKEKLSLGFAKITGGPADFVGVNFPAQDAEARGDDKLGRKASGLLAIDGVLYLLVRNVGNAQLGWSRDHGATWSWADWKFTTSFGHPTFLNFGKNYTGARDGFVYVYSFDSDSAYTAADQMVLARVPKDRLAQRDAWEFFTGLDAAGQPGWSKDIEKRGAVFENAGDCYRGGVSYDAGLKRYLWCQIIPRSTHPQGMRFQGGFGIYDAPEPWGPWTTVFHTENWDVGPGEASSFPPKWMSADGKTIHLVFSGNDAFSVRKATLITETK
jgi:CubicO group peptidase (beta-lactamase class C family)